MTIPTAASGVTASPNTMNPTTVAANGSTKVMMAALPASILLIPTLYRPKGTRVMRTPSPSIMARFCHEANINPNAEGRSAKGASPMAQNIAEYSIIVGVERPLDAAFLDPSV